MRRRNLRSLLLLWLALVFVALPAQAHDRFDALSHCAGRSSHSDQRECLEQWMTESLASLDMAEKELMAKLQNADQEPNLKQRAIVATKADAQAFVAYAAKHCEAFASLAFGGNSQHDRRLACHVELNEVRTQQVNKIAKSVP